MARTLLDPAERKRRADASKRNWLAAHWEYNKLQKQACAARPEYLALRRERYHARKPLSKPRKPRKTKQQEALPVGAPLPNEKPTLT